MPTDESEERADLNDSLTDMEWVPSFQQQVSHDCMVSPVKPDPAPSAPYTSVISRYELDTMMRIRPEVRKGVGWVVDPKRLWLGTGTTRTREKRKKNKIGWSGRRLTNSSMRTVPCSARR